MVFEAGAAAGQSMRQLHSSWIDRCRRLRPSRRRFEFGHLQYASARDAFGTGGETGGRNFEAHLELKEQRLGRCWRVRCRAAERCCGHPVGRWTARAAELVRHVRRRLQRSRPCSVRHQRRCPVPRAAATGPPPGAARPAVFSRKLYSWPPCTENGRRFPRAAAVEPDEVLRT